MRFPGFDMVLGLAAGAVDVLIDGAPADAVEAGDDKAGVDALRSALNAGDDALDTVPACRTVVELLEAAQLRTACRGGGGAPGRAGLQRGDVLSQGGGRRDAERVVQTFGTAEAQHFGCAVMAVGAQQDRRPRPVRAQRR